MTRAGLRVLAAAGVLAALAAVAFLHLSQGVADVSVPQVWAGLGQWLGGGPGTLDQPTTVVIANRIPRLLAAITVGLALGAAGAAMQGSMRNPLATSDTLAVNAGAYLALTLATLGGLSLSGLLGSAAGVILAFAGGLAAALLVIGLSAGENASSIRLILAGSALTMGLGAVTSALFALFPWQVQHLFAWGAGSLAQQNSVTVITLLPVVAVTVTALLLLGRRLDLLALGDDAARALGSGVVGTRYAAVLLSVLLAACAVTVAGPIGFIGLVAPAVLRLLARRFPALRRHRILVPMSAVAAAVLLLLADIVLRAVVGARRGAPPPPLPTGVATSLIGGVFLVLIAMRVRSTLGSDSLIAMRSPSRAGRLVPALILAGSAVVLVGTAVGAVLIGDATLLLGDLANWAAGVASGRISFIVETRAPRVLAALLAGAGLGLAGAIVQAITRNPLAEPSVLGINQGAALGAIVAIVSLPLSSFAVTFAGALAGAAAVAVLVLSLAARGGMDQGRTVLYGIGAGTVCAALTTLVIVGTDPWNQAVAITWLGGSTYGAQLYHLWPLVVVLGLAVVVLWGTHRDLDLLQFDEDTPRVLGISVAGARLLLLSLAVLLTAAAVGAVGMIGFVGLVAPHLSRLIIGKSHRLVLPLTALVGAILVVFADTVGRSVVAPAQLPAGVVVAVVGTPYFVWLLWRMRPAG